MEREDEQRRVAINAIAADPSHGMARGPSGAMTRFVAALLARWEVLSLSLLVLGAAWPQGPNSVQGYLHPGAYFSIWTERVGPLNLFELAFAGLGALWLIRRIAMPGSESSFDRPLIAGVAALGTLQLLALALNVTDVKFLPFDLEHVLVPMASYAIVTRCIHHFSRLRAFILIVAAAILVRASELVLVGGILSDTQFGTLTGRHALLITEDSLLVALPLLLAWGAFVDGKLRLLGKLATLTFAVGVFAVNLLSLRRGALLFTGAALLARSATVPRIILKRALPVAAVIVLAAVAFGPRARLVHDVGYVFRSALLQSKDASSTQRSAELRNFADNMHGVDWVVGKGVGTIWRARFQAPIDLASFGSRETAYTRIGWHVYGLDWAYKFGLAGLLVIFGTAVLLSRRLMSRLPAASSDMRGLAFSLAVCLLALIPFVFTGTRIGMVAGLVLGALSKLADLGPPAAQAEPAPGSRL